MYGNLFLIHSVNAKVYQHSHSFLVPFGYFPFFFSFDLTMMLLFLIAESKLYSSSRKYVFGVPIVILFYNLLIYHIQCLNKFDEMLKK